MTYENVLDLKGKVCPYTNIRALEELRRVRPEGLLKIIVDNSSSLEGIVIGVKNAGHKVVSVTQMDFIFEIIIKKG